MTPPSDAGDGPDDRNDPDGRDVEEPRGIIRSLLDLLQEMEERGERTRTGHTRPGPNTSVDYSISIGDLGGSDDADPPRYESAAPDGRRAGSDEEALDAHVTSRETPEGLVVAADLPGVDESDVESRLDPDAEELVIEVGGRDAARLPLESDGWRVVDSRFANGVLEVELRRD